MQIILTDHALSRLEERIVSREEIMAVLEHGEVIEWYPDDKPFPSRLISGKVGGRHLHVVAATDAESQLEYIVTVYLPNPAKWSADFRRRIKK